jgi:hypothetical protein
MLPPLRDALLNAAPALLNDVHFLAQRISLRENRLLRGLRRHEQETVKKSQTLQSSPEES